MSVPYSIGLTLLSSPVLNKNAIIKLLTTHKSLSLVCHIGTTCCGPSFSPCSGYCIFVVSILCAGIRGWLTVSV